MIICARLSSAGQGGVWGPPPARGLCCRHSHGCCPISRLPHGAGSAFWGTASPRRMGSLRGAGPPMQHPPIPASSRGGHWDFLLDQCWRLLQQGEPPACRLRGFSSTSGSWSEWVPRRMGAGRLLPCQDRELGALPCVKSRQALLRAVLWVHIPPTATHRPHEGPAPCPVSTLSQHCPFPLPGCNQSHAGSTPAPHPGGSGAGQPGGAGRPPSPPPHRDALCPSWRVGELGSSWLLPSVLEIQNICRAAHSRPAATERGTWLTPLLSLAAAPSRSRSGRAFSPPPHPSFFFSFSPFFFPLLCCELGKTPPACRNGHQGGRAAEPRASVVLAVPVPAGPWH